MTRRSTPQAKTDDAAFPVRVRLHVPPHGLGRRSREIHVWLDRMLGRGEYACHGGGRGAGGDRLALYFRSPADADAFHIAFPDLELADGTRLPGYSSPAAPFGRMAAEDEPICNLYNQTTTQEAMRSLFRGFAFTDRTGNLEPGEVYPDRHAPIIRHDGEALELVRARWGMPSPPSVLKTARDPGVTNVRNTASPHWRRWLGPVNRCLVPVTSFAEPLGAGRGNQWFAAADGAPMFFAGIEVRGWKSVRKVKDGETTDDLYAFLTTEPNAEVRPIHPKAMPVILTRPDEWDTWLTAPFEAAARLQRPLADGALVLTDAPL
ncbi:SOS response-associated peptidase [Paracoccus sp. S-4012]|uniref:SOS response-associated peptidase n=1 Tax=Paracoccus sp. S-4012 TaxID=2665648 RepID=UPI001E433F32|nr:SOS response-associated peptidase [Paracoccus sp. S-4012]